MTCDHVRFPRAVPPEAADWCTTSLQRPDAGDEEMRRAAGELGDQQRQLEQLLAKERRLDQLPELREAFSAAVQLLTRHQHLILGLLEVATQRDQRQADLQQRLRQVEQENRAFVERFVQLERRSTTLAALYVASHRLHQAGSREELLETIQEIVVNIVGSEELAVFELSPDRSHLKLVSSLGVDAGTLDGIPVGRGLIGECARTGQLFVAEPGREPWERGPSACIPLRLAGEVSGVIAIFRLLPQKGVLGPADRELFELLAVHAATALHCTAQRSGADRERS